jgi:hypothetical protein
MTKIYSLKSDLEKYSHFLEQYKNVDESFIRKYWNWKYIDLNRYEPVIYKLHPGENRKKNYHMDISTSHGLIIFSEKAIVALRDILEKNGQIVPIITESKRKIFLGFYANKNIYDDDIINLEKSEYSQYENGKVFGKIVLNNNYPKDDYIFSLSSYSMGTFVTDKFKQLVETHDLKGFDFSEFREVQVSD